MKAIMVMYDSLNRHLLQPYGCQWTQTENFQRLAEHTVVFDNCWVGSMPCMPEENCIPDGITFCIAAGGHWSRLMILCRSS